MIRKLIQFFIVLVCSAAYCYAQLSDKNIEHHFFNDLSSVENPGYWMNLDTRKQDETRPGNFYSATDSQKTYGLGFESEIPGDLKKKNIYLFIRGKLRITNASQNIQLVTNLFRGDSTIIWKGENVAGKYGKPNEWCAVHDSLLIPSNLPADTKIKIYIWNENGKGEADFDDLDIHLSVLQTPSYIVQ